MIRKLKLFNYAIVVLMTFLLMAFLVCPGWAQLPQNHPYQVELHEYLSTLKRNDFEVPLKPLTVDPSYFSSDDEIYRAWLFFGYQSADMMGTRGLRVDPSLFTLDKIEDNGQVKMTVGRGDFMNPIATAFYADWDYEGNPHYDSRAIKLRAFVASAVDMMMQDQDHEQGNNKRSDFLGLQLIRWAYAYGVAKDVLPQKVKNAYEQGLIRMFEKLERWGPTGIHADMDMGAIVGMLYTAKFVDSANLTQRAHQHIDLILKGFLSDVGYINHGSAYDAGYNGISLYFLNWAAQLSGYEPVVSALKKMSKLKAYMTLPDPDGQRFSPFQSNPSSGTDAPHDLWGPYYRDIGIANFSDNAVYLAYKGGRKMIHSRAVMLSRMAKSLFYFNGSNPQNQGQFHTPSNTKPDKWVSEHWTSDNAMNATAFYYKKGLYNKLRSLQNSNSPLTKPPFLRNGNFTESFADKILSVKRENYGTILFNDRLSWWTKEGKTKELNGFGGGNIAAFWTPKTGTVLLGGSRGTHSTGLNLDEWREWPVHTLSGETSDGKAFSSGLQRYPEASYELNKNPKTVTITGDLADKYSDPRDGLQNQTEYRRVFEIRNNGLEVTTSVNSNDNEKIKGLYEILPVYRRNAYRQSSARPTSIEFKVDGSWKQAGTELEKVTSIRLKRFRGQVYITFNKPRKVKLSAKDFYQNENKKSGLQARNIMIDMLGADNHSVTYTISTSEHLSDIGNQTSSENTTTSILYPEGWNLVSLPANLQDKSFKEVYSNIVYSTINTFKGTNRTIGADEKIIPGKGYWIKFSSPQEVAYKGPLLNSVELELRKGWNLIGGLSSNTNLKSDLSDPEKIVSGIYKTVTAESEPNDYRLEKVSTLKPGKAYYLKAKSEGTISLISK